MSEQEDIPPAPSSRHPLSDPKELERKRAVQCQACFQPKQSGQTFFRCTGCKIDVYCSAACQKTAWPTHKAICARTQLAVSVVQNSNTPELVDVLAALRVFTGKHRLTLAVLGRHALQLQADPSNAERQFLRIDVRQRPAVRREHTFYAIDASVVPFSAIHLSEAADMQLNREQLDIRNREIGMTATFLILLVCEEPRGGSVAPFGFRADDLPPYDEEWKDLLMKLLNEGIIV